MGKGKRKKHFLMPSRNCILSTLLPEKPAQLPLCRIPGGQEPSLSTAALLRACHFRLITYSLTTQARRWVRRNIKSRILVLLFSVKCFFPTVFLILASTSNPLSSRLWDCRSIGVCNFSPTFFTRHHGQLSRGRTAQRSARRAVALNPNCVGPNSRYPTF